jgi:hypothetical protein
MISAVCQKMAHKQNSSKTKEWYSEARSELEKVDKKRDADL